MRVCQVLENYKEIEMTGAKCLMHRLAKKEVLKQNTFQISS
jgi:predicted transcriptional regulator